MDSIGKSKGKGKSKSKSKGNSKSGSKDYGKLKSKDKSKGKSKDRNQSNSGSESNSKSKSRGKPDNDKECYVCGRNGHFARDWSRANHDKMVNEVEVENVNAEPGKEYVLRLKTRSMT